MEGCDLMGLKDNSEIEQIQRGLEAFLEKELKSDKGAEGQEGEDFLEEYQRIGGLLEEKKVGKPYKKGGLQVIGQGGERLSDRTRPQRAGQGAKCHLSVLHLPYGHHDFSDLSYFPKAASAFPVLPHTELS